MSPPAAELATISTQPDRLIGCFEALEPGRPHEALPNPLRMGCAQSRAHQPRGGESRRLSASAGHGRRGNSKRPGW
jgi:hypothetical protein